MFNQYPYINENDLNLDYILKRLKDLEKKVAEFISLESVTYADPILWDITKQYAKNEIVLDVMGNAYISKQAVPTGVMLSNTDYWLVVFDYMGYVKSFDSNLTYHIEQNTDRATMALNVDDWLVLDDILYKVIASIAVDDLFVIGTNIERMTVEEFCRTWKTYLVNLVNQYKLDIDASELQYKNDIDASELAYRQQLAGDIANTTASLQSQLNAAIAGVTVDSEVINGRIGDDGVTYATIGDAIRTNDGNLVAALNTYIREIADTNLVATATWAQGGYGAITNYLSPNPSVSVRRARTEIVFDTPIALKVERTNTDFQYTYAAFDNNNDIIDGTTEWTTVDTDILYNVKTLRLTVKWTADEAPDNQIRLDYRYSMNWGIKVKAVPYARDFSDILSIVGNLHNGLQLEWVQGTWAHIKNYDTPEPSDSNLRRIRMEKVFDNPTDLTITLDNPQYMFVFAAFDVDNRIIWGTTNYDLTPRAFEIGGVKTLRMIMRNQSDTSANNVYINPTDILDVGLKVDINTLAVPTKLKALTYNIGRFSYGVEPKYLSQDYDEKVANYKRFFSEEMADIMGMQECNSYLDVASGTGTKNSDDVIFGYLYPYHHNNNGNVCLKSKYELHEPATLELSTGRLVATGYIIVDGKSIFFASCHLTPNSGAENEAKRATERAELIALLQNKKYFILCGDFNAQANVYESNYAEFTTAGFKVANGGYLPYEWTYSYNPSDFSTDTPSDRIRYFDNIVVSGNILVDYSERRNVYADLSSDHIPFVANLTIN